ncbi:signal peptide peptidase-like, aspartyl protease family A22B [Achlya hypogyna]|uniref:Signal peptide peptidase-like, aspartyl protease family A22B n=1 Tax=Achlya hypogyna TaxID=1202772 RepID=A0A1V9ZE15_ACHHY|nr:signal peptide peptidase-like, aspartyl protease family A22B [Achlya hypogyna]
MFVSPSHDSGWGPPLPKQQEQPQMHALANGGNACTTMKTSYAGKVMVAERGNCSFLEKAKVAQEAGAVGLIIRNTREAVYTHDRNRTTPAGNLSTSMPSFATDCGQGEGYIAALDPAHPWLVHNGACSTNPRCASQICLPTGLRNATTSQFQVCCMWDTHLLMGANTTLAKDLNMPVVFATVVEGEFLAALLASSSSVVGTLSARPIPFLGLGSLVLWAIGVATAVGGAYYAAGAERRRCRAHKPHADAVPSVADEDEDDEDDVLHLSLGHAVGFIVVAGGFLTFLYFVHVGAMLSVLFGLSSLSTVTLLVTYPALKRACPCLRTWHLRLPGVGSFTVVEMLALGASAVLVVAWFCDRDGLWPLQDLFGVALCCVFLKTIRLPNLKIGALLLVLAFFYDIFFVFLTPYIFGKSVMVDVATGGPPASARDGYPGVDFCERYPTFAKCVDPDPLPMLLVFPRLGDWRRGRAMLGLGDIVLPGLLLAFVLRFDYTRRMHLKLAARTHRYYGVAAVGYAVGLFLANAAVVLMNMGQPALLYLVPCTLGAVAIAAHFGGDLPQMWHEGLYPAHPMAPIVSASPVDFEAGDEAPLLADD